MEIFFIITLVLALIITSAIISGKNKAKIIKYEKAETKEDYYNFKNNLNKKHANFTTRLMANIIDFIVIGIPIYLILNKHEYMADILMAIIIILLWTVWKGQSIGKKIVNIKIVNNKYEDINLITAIIRYLGYFVSLISFFIGFAIIPFRKDKKALHDLIANTYVIHTDKNESEIENDSTDKILAVMSIFVGTIILISAVAIDEQNKELEKLFYGTTNNNKIEETNNAIMKQTQKIMEETNKMNQQFKKQMEKINQTSREK
ncbi:MAG: RDD family protein [Sulfurimonas sp.]|uniref:RDD family protein n=1 Tax=Sulfurimonas sp. TaxID=2022749 RepID=UPI00261FADA2|nr:RDD family protein [Sulfurimonas sp.]MDD5400149.1 RDD family protein [Sulfurimonas sp.]